MLIEALLFADIRCGGKNSLRIDTCLITTKMSSRERDLDSLKNLQNFESEIGVKSNRTHQRTEEKNGRSLDKDY